MLPALVEQIYVSGVFDIGRSHCSIHDQLAAILLFLAAFLLGRVGILSAFGWFPSGRLGIILVIVIGFRLRYVCGFSIISVHIPPVLRPFPGADILVDPRYFFYGKSFPEMHHHGRVEQRLLLKLMEPQEVLHVWVLLNFCHAFFIGKVPVFLDEYRAKGNSRRKCPATCFRAHGAKIDLFDMIPGHDSGQPYPAIPRVKLPTEGHDEVLYNQLIFVLNIIHSKHPRMMDLPLKPPILAASIILHSGGYLNISGGKS